MKITNSKNQSENDEVQIRIRLPKEITNILRKEAEIFGFKLGEWINYILTQKAVESASQETEAQEFLTKILVKYKLTPHNYPYVNGHEFEELINSFKKDK